jgi:diketogulonate reductase-like aldo/keto reductase
MQTQRHTEIQGVPVPTFIYGTAWKGEHTSRLVRMALDAGFRGIDTANQRRHYLEAGVGEALADAVKSNVLEREDLFLQTKYTSRNGQDHRLPYDASAPVATQVEQSFASSLEHLGVERLDSYVLHGPTVRYGLADEDWEAWHAMELLQQSGKTRLLGVSNVGIDQLEELCGKAEVKPAMVQNRCFAQLGWDRTVRQFCNKQGLLYQGFSLLTANPHVMHHPRVHEIAESAGVNPAQVIFRFARQIGMIALTGTTSAEHAAQDLGIDKFKLEDEVIAEIEQLIG